MDSREAQRMVEIQMEPQLANPVDTPYAPVNLESLSSIDLLQKIMKAPSFEMLENGQWISMDTNQIKRMVENQLKWQLDNHVNTPDALPSTPMLSSDDQKGPLSDDAEKNIKILTKTKKKKGHRELIQLKDKIATGIRKRHVLKEEDGELVHFPVACDGDHPNADNDISANADILRQSEELGHRTELEAQEGKVEKNLQYQRGVENEAKQKQLAKQDENTGSSSKRAFEDSVLQSAQQIGQLITMDSREAQRMVESQMEPQLADPADTPYAPVNLESLPSIDELQKIMKAPSFEMLVNGQWISTDTNQIKRMVENQLKWQLDNQVNTPDALPSTPMLSTKTKKKKGHRELKDKNATGIRKRHVLKEEDGELVHFPVTCDGDHPNADNDISANADISRQSEELGHRTELEAQEGKVEKNLQYQRGVENEAKQKQLAKQDENTGSSSKRALEDSVLQSAQQIGQLITMDSREAQRMVESQMEPQLANPVDTPYAPVNLESLPSIDELQKIMKAPSFEMLVNGQWISTDTNQIKRMVENQLKWQLDNQVNTPDALPSTPKLSTKTKKKKGHRELKDKNATGIRKRHVLKEQDGELVHFPVTCDGDHPNADSDISANADILKQSEELGHRTELEAHEGKVDENLGYQRGIEIEAKQKQLAKQDENTDTPQTHEECRERMKKCNEKLVKLEGKKTKKEQVRDMINSLVAWEKELDEEIESLESDLAK
ncbi:uncharacterized protein LOC132315867 isoform X2 [Cornus florida]|uniref:uncharacterized protein LOC132315867 isoform X2 n=1 Tax=Cornus florida TaxID=4283 RepID=UPI0028977294|nr:uncharacterized protein LOC132315867 isoform X2 [Cornus florida]XP_059670265.1 uncharacterized protein LOC132315867 isoform X2 [Cornus florida]